MKFTRLFAVAVVLSAVSGVALGQQPPSSSGKGKVAFINTSALQSQIGEYKDKIESLNRQFEPRVKEIQGLNERITALENSIKAQQAVLAPARIAEMTENLEKMKRDQQRKSEDLQVEGDRASEKELAPLKDKLQKFLVDYTTKRGIVVLIDLAKGYETNTIVWHDQRSDVTEDFIKEYNKTYPSPSSGAPAKP